MKHGWWCAVLLGCADGELLPVVDRDGELAGTYDPAASALSIDVDAASAALSTGETVVLDHGFAWLDQELVPGDRISVLGSDGTSIGVLWVDESSLTLSESDSSTRFGDCGIEPL
ncbi:MAG: hypothetical protein ABMA64_14185 [Myxococcota bacterium]